MPTPWDAWNLQTVKARQAFAQIPGSPDGIQKPWASRDITVAQIDTGYTAHPVLGPIGLPGQFLVASLGLNILEPGQSPRDPLTGFNAGHGTATASILCGFLASTFHGCAPRVTTIPYRAVDDVVLGKKSDRAAVAQCIRHAIDQNGCDVVSISLGINMLNPFGGNPMGAAVDYAYDRGVIVVCAGGQILDRVSYPAKFFRTIGVGGVGTTGALWPNDPYYIPDDRAFIDVWAPGDDVNHARTTRQGTAERYDFSIGSGTSYAAPHVAACCAMWLLQRHDDIVLAYDQPWQRVEAFRRLIKSTAQPTTGSEHPAPGTGILDCDAVLRAPLPPKASLMRENRPAEGQWG